MIMTLSLGKAIFEARRTTRLTQAELASRLGLRVQTVSRWESGRVVPTRRNCSALVRAISEVDAEAGAELARVVNGPSVAELPERPRPSEISRLDAGDAVERAIFAMADELDLSPRRVRAGVLQLLRRLAAAGISLEMARRALEARSAEGDGDGMARRDGAYGRSTTGRAVDAKETESSELNAYSQVPPKDRSN
jgi:transcriptional regulator with XRE-family HTH domain